MHKPWSIQRWLLMGSVLFPFVFLLCWSFARQWLHPAILPQAYSGTNWLAMFGTGGPLLTATLQSLLLAVAVALTATLMGFIASRTIALHPQRKWWLFCCYLPFVTAPVVYALMLHVYFTRAALSGSWLGVLLAQLLVALPYAIIVLNSFWSRSIFLLEETAATLGCTPAIRFKKITIPVARPALTVCFFQCFLLSWFEYGLTSIIGTGKVQTLPLLVYQYINEANVPVAAMAGMVLIVPPVVLLFLNRKIMLTNPASCY